MAVKYANYSFLNYNNRSVYAFLNYLSFFVFSQWEHRPLLSKTLVPGVAERQKILFSYDFPADYRTN